MAKIKLTKNELKAQRDALARFERYLPTLQLKKQQLQMEVRRVQAELRTLEDEEQAFVAEIDSWLHLLRRSRQDALADLLQVEQWQVALRNVAGVETPEFVDLTFKEVEVDLFATPAWYDDAIDAVRNLARLQLRQRLVREQGELLQKELRVTTQRVNLFEKVKIPEAKENIRRIRIYLGDQQANAVGRAKLAKEKIRAKESART